MTLEKRFVDRDIFDADTTLAYFEFQDSVHQQDGIAVGQMLENLFDIESSQNS